MNNFNGYKLKIVLVGLGRVAEKHLKAITHLADIYQIVALVDANPNRAYELQRKFSLNIDPRGFFTSLEDFYATGQKADVVSIATPSGTHYSLAKLALEHDANLMLEKPLTLNLKEADEILELANSKGLKIAVGHIYRFFPLVDHLQYDIANGKYGKILAADVVVRWGHDQAYYDQAKWRGTWAQDGGALMNQSVHALDLMCWLLNSEIMSVQGQIHRLFHNMEAEDYGSALLEMREGFTCRFEGTTNTPTNRQSAEFYISTEVGEIHAGIENKKPYFSVRLRNGRKLNFMYLKNLWSRSWNNGLRNSIHEFTNPHTGIFKDLAYAIFQNREPRANGLSGLKSVEAILAIYESALKDGSKVALPVDRDFTLAEMENFFD